jgi:NADH-quinone oxidoreductase subunit M
VNGFPWLTTLGVLPLIGGVVVAALPRGRELLAKLIALGVSLAVFALSVVMATQYKTGTGAAQVQFTEHHPWIASFGVTYSVGVDGIALVLIAMSTILVPIVILAGWHEADGAKTPVKMFFALILVLETMIIGVFAATDVFLFYVFFEAMLIPVYFLIGSFGGPQRSYAAVKFLLYSLLGGLLMLAALIGLYVVSVHQLGTGTFEYTKLLGLHIGSGTEKWLFLGFFAAFAIKAPLWPFHTWLPDAAAESTPGTAVLLVGVLDKVGTFGMIRLCLPLFPDASKYFTPVILVLAVVGILYGALVAIGQTDMMRLVAYTSLSHFGFITLGIFAMTSQGQSGSTLYMVNHGFSTAGLFIVGGFLVSRRGSKLIADYGGVQRVAPLLAGSFLVMGLASLALPGLSSFVSEFLVLVGTFTRYPVYAVLATLGIVLAAIYVLFWYQRVATGPATERVKGFRDLGAREMLAIAPLIALIVAIGFFPKPLLDVINPAVTRTLHEVHQTDPVPAVATAVGTAEGTAK